MSNAPEFSSCQVAGLIKCFHMTQMGLCLNTENCENQDPPQAKPEPQTARGF